MNIHAVSARTISILLLSVPVMATASELADLRDRIEALENRLESSLERSVTRKELEEAAEWKAPGSLVHMAGYADVGYTSSKVDDGSFQVGNFAPIFHYQYRDLLMVESELALKVTESGETDIDLEYLTVDLFVNDHLVLVAGKFLSPLGQFRQNLHPSWINKLPSAPAGFGHDQAAPNAEVGVQLRGGFHVGTGGVSANYAVYVGNGPALELTETGDRIEMVETPGLGRDGDGDKVYGGRFGLFFPSYRLDIGLSYAAGKASEREVTGDAITYDNARDYGMAGADVIYKVGNFDLRGEYVRQRIGALAASTAPDVAIFEAWYLQASHRFPATNWEVVVRYAEYDRPESSVRQWTPGVNYLFASNVVAKLAYESNELDAGHGDDGDRLMIQIAYGF